MIWLVWSFLGGLCLGLIDGVRTSPFWRWVLQ